MEPANVRFQHGLASNFDLIEAETALRRARIQLISAVADYIIGHYRFLVRVYGVRVCRVLRRVRPLVTTGAPGRWR
jgi:hypothetical protein